MPVTISPLETSEIPSHVRVELEAFRSHPRMPMLWPRGYTADLYAFYEAGMTKGFNDAECKFMKAVDDDTGEIVGGAEWTFALDPEKNAAAELTAEDAEQPEIWPIDGNWPMRRYFTRNLEQMLRDDMAGKAYIMLYILVVDPKFHGKGIGGKLLQWGVQQADELGVAMCLESTPAGLALYKKYGFTERRLVKADMKAFGWDQPYDPEAARRVWMIRDPQPRV